MSDMLFDILRQVTTATITTILLRKGIRRCWMNGPKPLSGTDERVVGPAFTLRFEGWSAEDSRPLLEHLYRHAARPEFTCRFRWREGSIAFWDNRATWHYAANDYHGERRLMHRITVSGCELAAA